MFYLKLCFWRCIKKGANYLGRHYCTRLSIEQFKCHMIGYCLESLKLLLLLIYLTRQVRYVPLKINSAGKSPFL